MSERAKWNSPIIHFIIIIFLKVVKMPSLKRAYYKFDQIMTLVKTDTKDIYIYILTFHQK